MWESVPLTTTLVIAVCRDNFLYPQNAVCRDKNFLKQNRSVPSRERFQLGMMNTVQESVQVFIFTNCEAVFPNFAYYGHPIAMYSAWLEIFVLKEMQKKI